MRTKKARKPTRRFDRNFFAQKNKLGETQVVLLPQTLVSADGINIDSWYDYYNSGAIWSNTGSARPTVELANLVKTAKFNGSQTLLGNAAAKALFRNTQGGVINAIVKNDDLSANAHIITFADPAQLFFGGGSTGNDKVLRFFGRTNDDGGTPFINYKGNGDYGVADRVCVPDSQYGLYGSLFDYQFDGIGLFQGGLTNKIKYSQGFTETVSQDKDAVISAIGSDGFGNQELTGNIMAIHMSTVKLTEAENRQACNELARMAKKAGVIITDIILVTGDSIRATETYEDDLGQRFHNRIWEFFGYDRSIQVRNIAISGSTAQASFDEPSGNSRPSVIVSKLNPNIQNATITNNLGVNDYDNITAPEDAQDQVDIVVADIQAGMSAIKAALPNATLVHENLIASPGANRNAQMLLHNDDVAALTDIDGQVDFEQYEQFDVNSYSSVITNASYYGADQTHPEDFAVASLAYITAEKIADLKPKYKTLFDATIRGGLLPDAYGTPLVDFNAYAYKNIILDTNGKVNKWKSDCGSDLMQEGVSAKMPTFEATGINGKPCISFDGVQQYLQSPADVSTMGTGQTIAMVVQYVWTPPDPLPSGVLIDGRAGSANATAFYTSGTYVRFTQGSGNNPVFEPVANQWHVMCYRNDGASSGFAVDSASSVTSAGAVGTASGFGMCVAANASKLNNSPVKVARILRWNEGLMDEQILAINNQLRAEFNITT